MPSKRTRKSRTGRAPEYVRMVLGLGSGINSVLTRDELKEMWKEWGSTIQAEFQRKYGVDGRKPFVQMIGEREGWIPKQ